MRSPSRTVDSRRIAEEIGGEHLGPPASVTDVNSLSAAETSDFAFCKYDDEERVADSNAGAIVCPPSIGPFPGKTIIRVERPREAFIAAADTFFREEPTETQIHPTATVDDGAEIGERCAIGPNAYVGDGVILGDGCTVKPGAVIGTEGFGYQPDRNGALHNMVHKGRVVLEDDVVVGANACIDRAVFEETRIGTGTKLHNMVHVAHNVTIGRNVRINQFSSLSGSVTVEDGARIHPHVTVANHVTVGEGATVGMNAGVLADVDPYTTVVGTPAEPIGEVDPETVPLVGRDE